MTFVPKQADIENKKWYLVDATDVVLGRLSTKAAEILQGKHKVTYMPNVDMGDYVVVVNAEKIKVRATAVPTDVISDYREFIKNMDMTPVAMDINPNAVRKLFKSGIINGNINV